MSSLFMCYLNVLRKKRDSGVIAFHRKFHTVLRCLAVQPRTVFGSAPCLKFSVKGYTPDSVARERYTYRVATIVYVNVFWLVFCRCAACLLPPPRDTHKKAFAFFMGIPVPSPTGAGAVRWS